MTDWHTETCLGRASRTEAHYHRRRRSSRCSLRCRGRRIRCWLRRRQLRQHQRRRNERILVGAADSRRRRGRILAMLVLNRSSTLIQCSICSRNLSSISSTRSRRNDILSTIVARRLRPLRHHCRCHRAGHLFLTVSSRDSSHHLHRLTVMVMVVVEGFLERFRGRNMEGARILQPVVCPRMLVHLRFSTHRWIPISDTRRRTRRVHSRTRMLRSMRTLALGTDTGLGRARAVMVLPRFLPKFQMLPLRNHRLANIDRVRLRQLWHQAVQTRSMWKLHRVVAGRTVDGTVAITASLCRR